MKLQMDRTSVEGNESWYEKWNDLEQFQPVKYAESVLGARLSRMASLEALVMLASWGVSCRLWLKTVGPESDGGLHLEPRV